MRNTIIIGLVLVLSLSACTEPEPRAIKYGHDNCAHCIMTLTDERYGAELVTNKGKIYTFDSIECLAEWVHEERTPKSDVHSMWIVDFRMPKEFIKAEDAFYLQSKLLHSPMGLGLSAYADSFSADRLLDMYGGRLIEWSEVQTYVVEARIKAQEDIELMQNTISE